MRSEQLRRFGLAAIATTPLLGGCDENPQFRGGDCAKIKAQTEAKAEFKLPLYQKLTIGTSNEITLWPVENNGVAVDNVRYKKTVRFVDTEITTVPAATHIIINIPSSIVLADNKGNYEINMGMESQQEYSPLGEPKNTPRTEVKIEYSCPDNSVGTDTSDRK